MSSPFSWNFTTGRAAVPVQHLEQRDADRRVESNDPNAQTLGVQFQASSSGFITGVRFYKEPDDTGAHIGSLWSLGGRCWRPGRSPARPPVGWQELDFSSPVAVTAGTTYVASYLTNTGHPA